MNEILLGKSVRDSANADIFLHAKYGNRHGMIAGATGTGKIGFADGDGGGFFAARRAGLPGRRQGRSGRTFASRRRSATNSSRAWKNSGSTNFTPAANPVVFWDIYGKLGHPVRATISEMGPTLFARLLELNDVQSGVLEVLFKLADDNGWLLLDAEGSARAADLCQRQGQRQGDLGLLRAGECNIASLRSNAACSVWKMPVPTLFFGEPALDLADLMRVGLDGRGIVNILAADQLILKPVLYSTFLLWLLSELFEKLPEVGDLDVPKLVFFFDEAHLLFDDCPPTLQKRVEQVVRLIRSKGVGVYFCSQISGRRARCHPRPARQPRAARPARIHAARPESGQRCGTNFASNPLCPTWPKRSPSSASARRWYPRCRKAACRTPVERALIVPPTSRIGAITDAERATVRARSPVGAKYDTAIDRESAFDILTQRTHAQAADSAPTPTPAPAPATTPTQQASGWGQSVHDAVFGTSRRQGMIEALAKSAARNAGGQLGRSILRGVLGSITRK